MRRNSWAPRSAGLAAAVIAFVPQIAGAAVVGGAVTGGSSGGSFALISPPATLGPDSLQSADLVAFDELQGVVLSAPLPVGPGLVLGVGSVVSSHVVAFDPAQGASLEGTVLFDEPIVGIVVGPPFGATNALFGLPTVTYVGAPALGPEMPDFFGVAMGDPTRLVLRIGANSPGDHFRVLTGTVVPEPAAAVPALLAAMSCAAAWGSSRRQA